MAKSCQAICLPIMDSGIHSGRFSHSLPLMYPDLNSRIMEGLVNTYKESGWLPEWASPGHSDCMIGSNSASLIADSYLKGSEDIILKHYMKRLLRIQMGRGPVSSVGRLGAEYYNSIRIYSV